MTTGANSQLNGTAASSVQFKTSRTERITTVFAGIGLSMAFGLTGALLALAVKT